MFAKLEKIQGNKLALVLDDQLDMEKVERFANGGQPLIELRIHDSRLISNDQRRKIYAMFHDISQYTGYDVEETKVELKIKYRFKFDIDEFSLSDTSVSNAKQFIDYLIYFCFEWDIPFATKTWDMVSSEYYAQKLCLKYRKCVLCGKPNSDVDHVISVGNRSRALVDHRDLYFMCLCRTHHNERHNTGVITFMNKYFLKPIKLKDTELIELGVMTRKRMNEIDSKIRSGNFVESDLDG